MQIGQTDGLKAIDIINRPVDIDKGKVQVGATPIVITGADSKKIGNASLEFNPFIEKPGENLLINPSFEVMDGDKPKAWNIGRFYGNDKDGKIATVNEGRDGIRCMSISQSGEDCAVDASPVPCFAGIKYKLAAWMKTENATGKNIVSILFYNGSQWHVVGSAPTQTLTGTNGWTQVNAEGVAPKGAALIRVNLISEKNSGTTWFDDIKLEEE